MLEYCVLFYCMENTNITFEMTIIQFREKTLFHESTCFEKQKYHTNRNNILKIYFLKKSLFLIKKENKSIINEFFNFMNILLHLGL